jgi:hypothetical protein
MPMEEFTGWQVYLDEDMNTPGKTEYYLAQIAQCVCSLMSKKKLRLRDFLHPVRFIRKRREEEQADEEQLNKTKAWFGAMVGAPYPRE